MRGKERKHGKVHTVRKAFEEAEESKESAEARDLGHQPGNPQTGESESVQKKEDTDAGRRILICVFLISAYGFIWWVESPASSRPGP